MENLAASFKASAANDEMYRQNSIGKYQSDARNCATNAGGKLPDVETEVIGQPFERKINIYKKSCLGQDSIDRMLCWNKFPYG